MARDFLPEPCNWRVSIILPMSRIVQHQAVSYRPVGDCSHTHTHSVCHPTVLPASGRLQPHTQCLSSHCATGHWETAATHTHTHTVSVIPLYYRPLRDCNYTHTVSVIPLCYRPLRDCSHTHTVSVIPLYYRPLTDCNYTHSVCHPTVLPASERLQLHTQCLSSHCANA